MKPEMTISVPVIRAIRELCLKESGSGTDRAFLDRFAPSISALSAVFNQRPGAVSLSSIRGSKEFPIAYTAYFLPSNLLKFPMLLLDLFQSRPDHPLFSDRSGRSAGSTIRILDLGAGPATSGVGFLDLCARYPIPLFGGASIDYLAIDQNPRLLQYGSRLLDSCVDAFHKELSARRIRFAYRTQVKRISPKSETTGEKFELVILSNLLNEMLSDGEKMGAIAGYLEKIAFLLEEGGVLVIIEPALRKSSRNLLTLRDLLLQNGIYSVLAPCLHQLPCPIIGPQGSERDWCHQERFWQTPSWIESIDRRIGNRKDSLKYSYLTLSRRHGNGVALPNRWRAVSELIESKGKREIFLCNETGRKRFYLLRREESHRNSPFTELKRGDLVDINVPDGVSGTRVGANWSLKRTG